MENGLAGNTLPVLASADGVVEDNTEAAMVSSVEAKAALAGHTTTRGAILANVAQ